MKVLYLLLSVISVALAAPPTRENFKGFLGTQALEDYNNHVRIVGGYEVVRGEYPYQAGLLISIIGMEGTGLCGGSLISETRVMTAAHCWNDGVNEGEMMQVVLGAHRINEFEDNSFRLNTNDVVVHPEWTPSLIRNDIAIVKFPAVPLSQYIGVVRLPTGEELNNDYAQEIAYASGWGIVSNNAPAASPFLQAASMRIISNEVCARTSLLLVTVDNICTSGLAGSAVCNGDSGGPLVVYDHSNVATLVGVTSFRHLFGCESLFPSMFVRITSYIDWILQEM